jgi:phosphoribosylamine--glycine ligase
MLHAQNTASSLREQGGASVGTVTRKRILIVGGNGREAAIAQRLVADAERFGEEITLYAVAKHANPSVVWATEQTNGLLGLMDPCNPELVATFAREQGITMAIVSSDAPLEAGVVDALQAAGVPLIVGPTRDAAEIEWSKTYSRTLLNRIMPEVNPRFQVFHLSEYSGDIQEQESCFKSDFRYFAHVEAGGEVAVKPDGLTGGKGVKVMGVHMVTDPQTPGAPNALEQAADYAWEWLRKDGCVIAEERMHGLEFTVQFITDGLSVVPVPASYDYPYRFDGDTGPGTGGMGAFTDCASPLPFMSEAQYQRAYRIAKDVIKGMSEDGKAFNGILNVGYFLTPDGTLKVTECNSRFGDPECMNHMMLLDDRVNVIDLMERIATQTLEPERVIYLPRASVLIYAVAPEYALPTQETPPTYHFRVDTEAAEAQGVRVYFSAAEATEEPNQYRTTGTSRNVAFIATADSIAEARAAVDAVLADERIVDLGGLQYRRDIGATEYVQALTQSTHDAKPRLASDVPLHFLLVGHGAREYAIAKHLIAEGNTVSVVMAKENSFLHDLAQHATYVAGYEPKEILSFAKEIGADCVIPATESALYAGVVDACRREGIPAYGPTRAVAQLESNKVLSKRIAEAVDPTMVPHLLKRTEGEDVLSSITTYYDHRVDESQRLVLKMQEGPRGSGVFILSSDKEDALEQAHYILQEYGHRYALLEPCVEGGQDVSLYAFADGEHVFFAPAIQDYPFRYAGNTGPKTGGMGAVAGNDNPLPFMDDALYERATRFCEQYFETLKERYDVNVQGMFSFQFILSGDQLLFNELDVRPGDPEIVNLLDKMESPLTRVIVETINGSLSAPVFSHQASVTQYYVPPYYPEGALDSHPIACTVDEDSIKRQGCNLYYGNMERTAEEGRFLTGSSRTLIISAVAPSVAEARERLQSARPFIHGLDVRDDIGLFPTVENAIQSDSINLSEVASVHGQRI